MQVRMNDGRIKDVPITQVTKENYIVAETAKHVYHCLIEVRKFNPETGERLSRPRVQKFGKKAFESNVFASLKQQGYTITILHDPNEYIAKQKEMEAVALAETEQTAIEKAVAEALAKAEVEKQKEIKAAVAKALAERKKPGRKPKNDAEESETAEQNADNAELNTE